MFIIYLFLALFFLIFTNTLARAINWIFEDKISLDKYINLKEHAFETFEEDYLGFVLWG